jgi:hypothetical protein
MSIVEDLGTPHEPVRRPLVGWLIAIAIPIVQIAYAISLAMHTSGDARAVAAAHNAVFSWDDSPSYWAFIVGALFCIGIPIIPGAFGFTRRQIVPFLPRGRWIIVGAFVALALAADVLLTQAGERGGFADAGGAAWTVNGRVVARHGWSEASQRITSCRMTGRHSDTPSADYTVRFADGRSADLSNGLSTDSAGARARRWIARVTPVEQRLNALPQAAQAGFQRTERLDSACLSRFTDPLSGDEAGAFRALLHAPAASAK